MKHILLPFQGKCWKWEEGGFTGQVELLDYDSDGNPIWKHTFQGKFNLFTRYYYWYYRSGHWIESVGSDGLRLTLKGGVEQPMESPFPKIRLNCWGNSGVWKQVGIGLDRCFQKMEKMNLFVKGNEKIDRKFIFLLLLCKGRWIKDTNFGGNIPLEIILIITTFMRRIDIILDDEVVCN